MKTLGNVSTLMVLVETIGTAKVLTMLLGKPNVLTRLSLTFPFAVEMLARTRIGLSQREFNPNFRRYKDRKKTEGGTMTRCSKCLLVCVSLVVMFLMPSVTTAFQQEPVRQSMLVSTKWLQDHLSDPSVVIVHVGNNRREYRDGHIPGARFLWVQSLAYSDPDLTLEVPTKVQADSVLRKLGVSDRGRIILYFDGSNVTPTTRMYFTLDYLGLGNRVSLLDGGLDAWKADGRPVVTEIPAEGTESYSSTLTPGLVASSDWLKDNLNNAKISIVDARTPQYYAGTGGGMPRPGHIPGALNIPFSSLLDSTNRLKDSASLKSIFQQAGVKRGSRVISYCHIGQQASLVYFVAKYLGYDAQLYDGSFEEWSGRKDLPIVNPAAATIPKK
jgi:thiosulfate/3-mercaptopyruvate sulfurtransferase